MGFAGVLAGPLVRSSYRAGRLYAQAMGRRAAGGLLSSRWQGFVAGSCRGLSRGCGGWPRRLLAVIRGFRVVGWVGGVRVRSR